MCVNPELVRMITSDPFKPGSPNLCETPGLGCYCFGEWLTITSLYIWTDSQSWLFHSLDPQHIYWSRQPKIFRHLKSLLCLPKASFDLWILFFACFHVSMRQPLDSPHDNLRPIQARITKFGPQVQNSLVEIPIVYCWGLSAPWLLTHSR